jgi:outer membrane protein TolC
MTIIALLAALSAADYSCTLGQAVQRARDSATASLAASQKLEDEALNRREALSHLLPKVEVSATQLSQSANMATYGFSLPGFDPYISFYSIQDVRVSTSFPVVNLGLWRRLEESRSAVSAKSLDRDANRALSGLQGGLAWLELARSRALVKDREEAAALARTLSDLAQAQRAAGGATRLDVVRAQAQETQAQRALSMARYSMDKASLVLGRILGLGRDGRIVLAGELSLQPEATLPAALDEPVAVRSARAGRETAERGVTTAKADFWPTISAFGDYGYIGTHLQRDGLWTGKVGVAASWEVFDGFGREVEVGRARVRERLAEISERDAQMASRQDEQDALSATAETAEQLRQAMSASALADTELVLAQEKFRAGASGNSEVVQAQGNQAQAHAAWIDAAGAHQAAILRLRWARDNWEGL